MRSHEKIEEELLRLCQNARSGSRLTAFEDWAATRHPAEVEYGRQFLSRTVGSFRTTQPRLTGGPQSIDERRKKDPRFPLACTLTIRNLTAPSGWQAGTLHDASRQALL